MTSSAHPTLPAMDILLTLLVFVAPGLAISIEDSGIVCKEEGFHPHPTTCAKFYRCVRWSGELELVLFQCAPGTIWLPGDTVCAHLEGDACQLGLTSKAPTTTVATTPATTTVATTPATTPATTTAASTTEAPTTPAPSPTTASSTTTTTEEPSNTGASKCSRFGQRPTARYNEWSDIDHYGRSGLVAHGDCHHFWLCFWVSTADIIEPHLYRCPDGEIFSVNGHKCGPESASHTCQPSEIPPPANVPVNQLDPTALLRAWGLHTVQRFPWALAVF